MLGCDHLIRNTTGFMHADSSDLGLVMSFWMVPVMHAHNSLC